MEETEEEGCQVIRRGARVSLVEYFQVDVLCSIQSAVIRMHYFGLGLIQEMRGSPFKGRENRLLNTIFKALHYNDWQSYHKLDIYNPTRTLKSSNETTLKVPFETVPVPMFLIHHHLPQATL